MIRRAPRLLIRSPFPPFLPPPNRRLLSTAPPAQKSRGWKSKATRLGLAVGVIYYYNTSTLFAEEPSFAALPPPSSPSDETSLPTLESVRPGSRQDGNPPAESTEPETLEEREQQASQEGAFNEETGEINWDCPCLGGMAHGPCGGQFRAAFSCFVFSKAEPKGMDCIENFKTMQTCFREHPDIYGAELQDDDDEAPPPEEDAPSLSSPAPSPASSDAKIPVAATSASPETQPSSPSTAGREATSDTERAQAAKRQVERDHGEPTSEIDELVPKAAHDATGVDARK